MSVATQRTHIISCDSEACTRTVKSRYNLDTAQLQAVRRGWQVSHHPQWDGGVDLCPEHKEHPEGDQHGDDSTDRV